MSTEQALLEFWNNTVVKLFRNDNTREDAVDFIKADLLNVMPKYKRISDCIGGNDTIKKNPTEYLPVPNPTDKSEYNKYRYKSYVEKAVFYPFLQQTTLGLIGLCFIYDPLCNLPKDLDKFKSNVDGSGDIYEFSRKTLAMNINYSRAGILADYPSISDASLRDSENTEPSILLYSPMDIINWRESVIDNKKVLTLVVLKECHDSTEYKFKQEITSA